MLLLLVLVAIGSLAASPGRGRPVEVVADVDVKAESNPDANADVEAAADARAEKQVRLSRSRAVVIRRVAFEGNTVVPDRLLEECAAPYLNRPISMGDLQAMRLALTRLYVDRGYVNSGAVLPDQTVEEGVLRIVLVEGRLGRIRFEGNDRFNSSTLAARIRASPESILDLAAIEERLQWLRRDPRIERVAAELRPGLEPGLAELHVRIAEASPTLISAQFDNHISPAIGELHGSAHAAHLNVTGVGDTLQGSVGFTEGLIDVDLQYQRPVNRYETRVGFYGRYSESDIVESPFDELNIESRLIQISLEVVQPYRPNLETTIETGLVGEWIEARSTLDGISFDFTPGSERGVSRVAALRWVQSIVHSTSSHAISALSTLSIGLPILDATQHSGSREDGRFVAWLARGQWVERMPLDSRLVLRGELQLASGPVLPVERLSIGGADTVRGFRQNQLVRDTGFSSSVELRIPIWRRLGDRDRIEIAPFLDGGRTWNSGRGGTPGDKNLLGAGIGLRADFARNIHAEVYWASALSDRPDSPTRSLQDHGLHFLVAFQYR